MFTRDALLQSAWYWLTLGFFALLTLYCLFDFAIQTPPPDDPTCPWPLRLVYRVGRWLCSPLLRYQARRESERLRLRNHTAQQDAEQHVVRAFGEAGLDVSGYWVTADRKSERQWRYLPGGVDLLADSTRRPQEREAEGAHE